MTNEQLVQSYIAAQAALRARAGVQMAARWDALPSYDRADIPSFLAAAVPLARATKAASVRIVSTFLAQRLKVPPLGVSANDVTIRNGANPLDVYTRPFINVWSDLKDGRPFEEAVAAGRNRASSAVQMDAQLAMRETLRVVAARDERILGYRRVPDAGACDFCKLISGQRYTIEQLMPVHNHCVTGDAMVWSGAAPSGQRAKAADLAGAHAATRRWYAGEVVSIETAAGYELSVTPNHPILTDRGWVHAGLLREGDSVISSLRPDGVVSCVPDEEHMPARVEECFGAGSVAVLVAVPFASENFHGDAGDGEVNVVFSNGDLDAWVLSAVTQPREHLGLPVGLDGPLSFSGLCPEHSASLGLAPAPLGVVRGGDARSAFDGGLSGGADGVLLADRAERHAGDHEMSPDGTTVDAVSPRELQDRLAGQVQLDSVRHTGRIDWSGHVFNLVTSQGWYTANAIVTHNCGCGVDVITEENRGDFTGKRENDLNVTRDGVSAAVVEHGELGPLVVDGADHFTSHAAIAA